MSESFSGQKQPRIAVFLGPSYSPQFIQNNILPFANYYPPARRGDVQAVLETGVEIVVLIDGHMIQHYPPSPMEVNEALKAKIRVFGAASLGALRAVELHDLGMEGRGWVYAQYRNGVIDRDDEVVTLMDPITYHQIGLSLVQIRYAANILVAQGTITHQCAKKLINKLSGIHFSERSVENVYALATECGIEHLAAKRMVADELNIKRWDAIQLLLEVARVSDSSRALERK